MGTARGTHAAVATADRLATTAGIEILRAGGNAVDAAIAANAVMAVTGPHLCGMGGDLFAVVHHHSETFCLNASGRAGSGATAGDLRRAGLTEVPLRHEIRAVTVPGCVDGWMALHARFGSMPLDELFGAPIGLAEDGFAASPLLVRSLQLLDAAAKVNMAELAEQATTTGRTVRRPGAGRALRTIAGGGRKAFYEGEFGNGLRGIGPGIFSAEDLAASQAEWVTPLRSSAWGCELFTAPPNSQGYLFAGSAALAYSIGLPDDPDDPEWVHLLIECATAAGFDRPAVLHEAADGDALLTAIADRRSMVGHRSASERPAPSAGGDTTYLCTADGDGMVVSLIQSNASGFGSWIAEPSTGINLHNRGMGFSLAPGHPAELAPGRRPPHTLSPALAVGADGSTVGFGTMGGDAQPQILLQLAARLFQHRSDPGAAVDAPRWVLHGPSTGFDTWTAPDGPGVLIEGGAPAGWDKALRDRGYRVHRTGPLDSGFGHAQVVVVGAPGSVVAAADPRTVIGSAEAI